MADRLDFRLFTDPFKKMVDDRQKRMPRAGMWAVREAGRVARREAKRVAPVLKDKNYASTAQISRRKKAGENVTGAYDQPVRGLLRASIKPSRHVRIQHDEYRIAVGPRGERVHLYAEKIELQAHYMDAGARAANLAMPTIARQAFERTWKGR